MVDSNAAVTVASRFYHVVTGPNREVISDPAGYYSLPLNPGANALSIPLHRIAITRGLVVSVSASGNVVTVNGSPGWAANSLAAANGFTQYVLMVLNDPSASPGSTGIQGDWWLVTGNTANILILDPGLDILANVLAPGSAIAVLRLVSIKDLFGYGATSILNKDSDFSSAGNSPKGDVIRIVSGTSFGSPIFYHDGTLAPQGYYMEGLGALDGSTITLWPGQGLMVFRAINSTPTNFAVTGGANVRRVTLYLQPGANMVGIPFAGSAPIGNSNLKESGWNQDSNFGPLGNFTTADVLRPITGTSFGTPVFYHDGTLAPAGWYQGGQLNNNYPLQPGQAYLFLNNGTGLKRWRQAVPYGL